MLKNIIITFSLLLSILSCTDDWDKHYNEDKGPLEIIDKTVYEYLNENSHNYEEFAQLLKKTNADTVLQTGHNYTIWITDSIPESFYANNDSIQGLTLQNHILMSNMQRTAFKDNLPLKTIPGKLLWMDEIAGDFFVNDYKINSTVVICKDGIIYDVDGLLERQKTLQESFWEDPNYSLLREIIEKSPDSTLVDVITTVDTITGEVLIDSIFDNFFTLFNKVAIDKDRGNPFTIFLTKNDQLQERIDTYFADVKNITEQDLTEEDSTKIYNFVSRSFIHGGAVEEEDYYSVKSRRSAYFNILWRTDYQQIVASSLKRYSNGYAYEMSDLAIPTSLIKYTALPYNIATIHDNFSDKIEIHIQDEYAVDVEVTSSIQSLTGGLEALLVSALLPASSNPPTYDFSLSWTVAEVEVDTINLELKHKEIVFLPGEYLVELGYTVLDGFNQDFDVLINGEYLESVEADPSATNLEVIVKKLGRINQPYAAGAQPINITIENKITSWKRGLSPVYVKFTRTINNY